jgi:hypothetical protein
MGSPTEPKLREGEDSRCSQTFSLANVSQLYRKKLSKAAIQADQVTANRLKGMQEDHVLLHSFEGEDEHDPLHLPVRQHRTLT